MGGSINIGYLVTRFWHFEIKYERFYEFLRPEFSLLYTTKDSSIISLPESNRQSSELDNAPCQKSMKIMAKLNKCGFEFGYVGKVVEN